MSYVQPRRPMNVSQTVLQRLKEGFLSVKAIQCRGRAAEFEGRGIMEGSAIGFPQRVIQQSIAERVPDNAQYLAVEPIFEYAESDVPLLHSALAG